MTDSLRDHYDAHPDPSPVLFPVGPGQIERIDDNLSLEWSWHRFQYVYRRFKRPCILDAGCGTGLTSIALARLNPGAHIVGLDFSEPSLAVARERAEAAAPQLGEAWVEFRTHDLHNRLPADLPPFDFIVCRNVLHLVRDPVQVLGRLAAALDQRGLLLLAQPSQAYRHAASQIRQAVTALATQDSTLEERADLCVELLNALRPDHPIRRLETQVSGAALPTRDRIVSTYLSPQGAQWNLLDLEALLEGAGLRHLYVASNQPWQAERVFQQDVSAQLRDRVARLDDRARDTLREALDLGQSLFERKLYACPGDFDPRIPAWAERVTTDLAVIDLLISHPSGLVTAVPSSQEVERTPLYRTSSGAVGPVDPVVDLNLRLSDGKNSCRDISKEIQARTGFAEPPEVVRSRWLEMANRGFVFLESPDPRQHLDCRHLGSVRDRLDCPCPRKWIRACERHGNCSIDEMQVVGSNDPRIDAAVLRLGLGSSRIATCATCPDYDPDE